MELEFHAGDILVVQETEEQQFLDRPNVSTREWLGYVRDRAEEIDECVREAQLFRAVTTSRGFSKSRSYIIENRSTLSR